MAGSLSVGRDGAAAHAGCCWLPAAAVAAIGAVVQPAQKGAATLHRPAPCTPPAHLLAVRHGAVPAHAHQIGSVAVGHGAALLLGWLHSLVSRSPPPGWRRRRRERRRLWRRLLLGFCGLYALSLQSAVLRCTSTSWASAREGSSAALSDVGAWCSVSGLASAPTDLLSALNS